MTDVIDSAVGMISIQYYSSLTADNLTVQDSECTRKKCFGSAI